MGLIICWATNHNTQIISLSRRLSIEEHGLLPQRTDRASKRNPIKRVAAAGGGAPVFGICQVSRRWTPETRSDTAVLISNCG
jgi:hypothetical protein